MLYAKSLKELIFMTESLILELRQIGLRLNTSKTKILYSDFSTEENTSLNFDYVEINGENVQLLHKTDSHRYLGRKICMSIEERLNIELNFRRQQAWGAFQKHKRILLNKNVSLKQRLHYFDVCVTPAMLFALSSFPVTKKKLQDIDIKKK